MGSTVDKISAPDSALAREITELVRDTESPLLFHHSSRVYHWGALAGQRRRLKFDSELLYAGAMFHDMGLMHNTAVRRNDSRSTARTWRAIFCGVMGFHPRISIWSGQRSRSIRRPVFRSTCIRLSHS